MNPVRLANGKLRVPMTAETGDGYVVGPDVMVEIGPEHPDFGEWLAHATWHELSDEERAAQLLAPSLPLLQRLELRARRWWDYMIETEGPDGEQRLIDSHDFETPELLATWRAPLLAEDMAYLSSCVRWGNADDPGVPEGLTRWRAWLHHFHAPDDPEAQREWMEAGLK